MPIRRSVAAVAAACAFLALQSSISFAAPEVRPKVQSPFDGTPIAIPARIEAEKFDNGLSGESYSDTTAGNAGGAYRTTDVDIYALAGASNGNYVGSIANNEWIEFSVNVTQPGNYSLSLRHAGTATDSSLALSFDGAAPFATMSVPSTGGVTTFNTLTLTPLNLPIGQAVLRVAFPKGNVNIDWIEISKIADLPSVRLVTPAASLHINASSTLVLEAAAVDIASTITQVEFVDFFTGAVVGADTTPPFQFNWANIPAGSYAIRARATNAAGGQSTSASRLVVVRSASAFPSAAATVPGRIQAENFDSGSAHFDTTPGNAGNWYRTGAGLNADIAWGATGTFVDVLATEWLEYSVNVQHTGVYNLTFQTSAINWDARFAVLVDTVDVTGTLAPTNTGSFNSFNIGTRDGISLTAGPHVIRVSASAGNFALDWLEFTASNRAPVVVLTSPTQNLALARPATVSLAAAATDADGTVMTRRRAQTAMLPSARPTPAGATRWPSSARTSGFTTPRSVESRGGKEWHEARPVLANPDLTTCLCAPSCPRYQGAARASAPRRGRERGQGVECREPNSHDRSRSLACLPCSNRKLTSWSISCPTAPAGTI
jgi:hypothetical protein